jgi:putative transposase
VGEPQGEIPLRIPKLREGDFFPGLLEPCRRAENTLLVAAQAGCVQGVSTRKLDDLVRAVGLTGIDKSKVSRICSELDEFVHAFRSRHLEGSFPHSWLDAMYLMVRQDHRIVNQALVLAIAVRDTGDREILSLAFGQSEEYALWRDFLRGPVRRGLKDIQLVISDTVEVLKASMQQALAGAVFLSWNGTVIHKHGAFDPGYLGFRPSKLVLWTAIQWSYENGHRWFDFARSDLEAQDLRNRKAG